MMSAGGDPEAAGMFGFSKVEWLLL